ncbi:MAG: UDP-N-acetylmuramoyl-L-alanine--D-glutamate ligase [Halieaceae bacterium]
MAGAKSDCAFLDYHRDVGPVRTGNVEIALGAREVALAVVQDLIASSEHRLVVGLGPTGLSVARYLYARGDAFTVIDTRDEPPGLAELRNEMPEVPVFAGEIPEGVLTSASQLIVSPGLALDEPVVAKAIESGAELMGDIDLFAAAATAPIIGITGSNAKSTVTALLGVMADEAGVTAGVGGNLGTPALELLDDSCRLYIVELSSFQLERAGNLDLAVAAVLNITPDHLDRHGNMPRYHQAKHRIFRGCQKAVVNRGDPLTIPLVDDDVELISWRMGEPELNGFGLRVLDGVEQLCKGFEPLLPVAELGLAGRHNVANALAALAIGHAAGLAMPAMLKAVREFGGLQHRSQRVAVINGVSYINDSKATNVGATRAALEGLGEEKNLWLLAGGVGKGAEFSALRQPIERHCRGVILFGEAAAELAAVLDDSVPAIHVSSLAEAVASAAERAESGDTVLLSPACASFDMFASYVARGEAFCQLVEAIGPGDVS